MKSSAAFLVAAASAMPLLASASAIRGTHTAGAYTTRVISLDTIETERLVQLVAAARDDGTSVFLVAGSSAALTTSDRTATYGSGAGSARCGGPTGLCRCVRLPGGASGAPRGWME
eukprot:TRINITY_DN71_c0_g1_i11.p2 TRINITY_DN71_c0_g1~~TRINITY_DN71_c0_g1_i11.p2  ORF type:complete len:116 (-),score=20.33 TRINITY_DN71_c0_g1_i11:60-407(-)